MVPATELATATKAAREQMGRDNPIEPLAAMLPFPRTVLRRASVGGYGKHVGTSGRQQLTVPPPPVVARCEGGGDTDWIAPVPPDKPHVADKVRVRSIMDDRAIVAFPADICPKNGWPTSMVMAKGDQFDSVKLVQVRDNAVTFEEDGDRSTRRIEAVR